MDGAGIQAHELSQPRRITHGRGLEDVERGPLGEKLTQPRVVAAIDRLEDG
jgi:hypothetical protein